MSRLIAAFLIVASLLFIVEAQNKCALIFKINNLEGHVTVKLPTKLTNHMFCELVGDGCESSQNELTITTPNNSGFKLIETNSIRKTYSNKHLKLGDAGAYTCSHGSLTEAINLVVRLADILELEYDASHTIDCFDSKALQGNDRVRITYSYGSVNKERPGFSNSFAIQNSKNDQKIYKMIFCQLERNGNANNVVAEKTILIYFYQPFSVELIQNRPSKNNVLKLACVAKNASSIVMLKGEKERYTQLDPQQQSNSDTNENLLSSEKRITKSFPISFSIDIKCIAEAALDGSPSKTIRKSVLVKNIQKNQILVPKLKIKFKKEMKKCRSVPVITRFPIKSFNCYNKYNVIDIKNKGSPELRNNMFSYQYKICFTLTRSLKVSTTNCSISDTQKLIKTIPLDVLMPSLRFSAKTYIVTSLKSAQVICMTKNYGDPVYFFINGQHVDTNHALNNNKNDHKFAVSFKNYVKIAQESKNASIMCSINKDGSENPVIRNVFASLVLPTLVLPRLSVDCTGLRGAIIRYRFEEKKAPFFLMPKQIKISYSKFGTKNSQNVNNTRVIERKTLNDISIFSNLSPNTRYRAVFVFLSDNIQETKSIEFVTNKDENYIKKDPSILSDGKIKQVFGRCFNKHLVDPNTFKVTLTIFSKSGSRKYNRVLKMNDLEYDSNGYAKPAIFRIKKELIDKNNKLTVKVSNYNPNDKEKREILLAMAGFGSASSNKSNKSARQPNANSLSTLVGSITLLTTVMALIITATL